MIEVKDIGSLKIDRVNKLLAGIGKGEGLRNAVYNALSRAADSANTKAGQFAAGTYTISKGTFMARNKSKVSIKYGGGKLTGGLVSVGLRYAGGVIPLMEYDTGFRKNGVSAKVLRGGGGSIEKAFYARIYGPMRIFERVTSGRSGIEQKYGPSTAHMMQNEEVISQMDKTITEVYDKRIEHEITRILNGW